MTTIGFVGLGIMGGPMCRHIAHKTDARVLALDLNQDAVAECVAAGAEAATDLAQLTSSSSIIFTSLPSVQAVLDVALGEGGIAENSSPGTVYVDMTTNSPTTVRRIAAELQDKGIPMIDAPVSGMRPKAEAGTLSMMAGGDEEILESVRWVLDTFVETLIHMGPVGTGSITKIVNNLLGDDYVSASAEGLMIAAKAGVDLRSLNEVVSTSSGFSLGWQALTHAVLNDDYSPKMLLDLGYKDIHLALELGDELGVPMPMTSISHTLLRMGRGMGLGRQDYCAVIKAYESTVGMKLEPGSGGAAVPEDAGGGEMPATVGFIGLGAMGSGMCRNLIEKSGAKVIVFDLNQDAVKRAVDAGAVAASSIAEVAAGADVIFTSLPSVQAALDVALGEGGIAENAKPGTVQFELSSISPSAVKRIAAELAERDITMLDSPVSGGPSGASAGTLSLMIGGDRAVLERHRGLLGTFSANVYHLGDNGAGVTAKVVNNLLVFCYVATAAEGLMLASCAGIDMGRLIDAVKASSGNCVAFQSVAANVLSGDYSPTMTLDLGYKDVHLALELADELGVPAPCGSATHDLLRMARGLGFGQSDGTAIALVYENVLQRKIMDQEPALAAG